MAFPNRPQREEGSTRLPAPSPPDARAVYPRLLNYLDQLCASLAALVPEERRAELRAELQAHLEALVAAHEELGATPADAVTAALRQFGGADDLARAWRQWIAPGRGSAAATVSAGLVLAATTTLGAIWLARVPAQIGISPPTLALRAP